MSVVDEANRGDEAYPGYGRPNTTNEYYNKTFNSASSAPNNEWTALYTGIFRANQVIEAVNTLYPTLTTDADRSRATIILAQAKFFRGLFHYYLYTSFNNGSVITFDFVPKTVEAFYKKLSPASDVVNLFKADLEYAYANLPKSWTGTDKARASAGAAASVLGQYYLYVKDYDNAAVYFKDVITNTAYNYSLTANIGDNFSTAGELNSESILEICYSMNFKKGISNWSEEQTANTLAIMFSPSIVGGYNAAIPSCWLTMAYKNDPIDPLDTRNTVTDATAPGGTRLRKYSLRTSYSIAVVDDPDVLYYQKTCAITGQWTNLEYAYFRKYTNWQTVTSEKVIVPNGLSGINYRVIRLADVYLMYAECLIKGGTDESGVNEAIKYINRVRNRSGLIKIGLAVNAEFPTMTYNNVGYTATQVMNHLMYIERPLELSIEGHATRVIDLRRWGITKARYAELATKTYYLDHYPYKDANGLNATRWFSVLNEVAGPKTAVDFVQSSTNYNEAAHAFWPIPNNETVANPNINN